VYKYFICLTYLLSITSCDFFSLSKKEKPVAKVSKSYLYTSEIKDIFPEFISEQDSITILENYINNWAVNQLVLQKAELNLSDKKKQVEQQLKDYRNSLIRFAYEQELINEYLDTIISATEIEKYYHTNIDNFELKENIVKVVYIQLDKKAPKLSEIKNLYQLKHDDDFNLLKSYALQYAKSYYLQDSIWINFEDLLKALPIETKNKVHYLHNNKFIELEDASFVYLVNIIDYEIKNSNSPVSYVEKRIKSIILNQRKIDLISNMEERLYNDATKNKTLEIY